MLRTIRDAYISVELKAEQLSRFQSGLLETLREQGHTCEQASDAVHVSIAYCQGDADLKQVETVASEIASGAFQVRAVGFEILEGHCTPYDYLVLTLESEGAMKEAVETVRGSMPCRRFEGGFKSHVSLLRFKKGELGQMKSEDLVRELNASHGAAFALGRWVCVEGQCVCVFSSNRERCFQVPFLAAQSEAAAVSAA